VPAMLCWRGKQNNTVQPPQNVCVSVEHMIYKEYEVQLWKIGGREAEEGRRLSILPTSSFFLTCCRQECPPCIHVQVQE